MYMKVHFELTKCINDQLTHAKHASRSLAEHTVVLVVLRGLKESLIVVEL